MKNIEICMAPYQIQLLGVETDSALHHEIWDQTYRLFAPGGRFGLPTRYPHQAEIESVLDVLSEDGVKFQWKVL